jgi:hypothetical protein
MQRCFRDIRAENLFWDAFRPFRRAGESDMPFIRVDAGVYDDLLSDPENRPPGLAEWLAENRPSGDFEYEPASGRLVPEELGPVARLVLDVLLSAGATHFRVRYDGGCDEGFAHPDTLVAGGETRSAVEALRERTTPELLARIRAAAGRDSMWGNAAELYAGASPEQAAEYALDELATELATRLLGEGFGTGECELYGAFTADLKTGELVDDPEAAKPEGME